MSSPDEPARLTARGLTIAVGGRTLVRALDLELAAGTFTCVLGRNGSGKTLALNTLAGLRAPDAGQVLLDGQPLASLSRRQIARRLALLTQTSEDSFPSTVLESVLVGRHPHLGFWQWESDGDRRIARSHLTEVDLVGCEERAVETLSGGERRRVAVATVLAQDPLVYLLDEPTNHLDPHHQIDVANLFRVQADSGRTVLMTLHEPGLAARYADAALLLFGDGEWCYGAAHDVLTETTLSRLYGTRVRELTWDSGRTFVSM